MTSSRSRQESTSSSSGATSEPTPEELVASTLAYVRTSDGVVEVQRGGSLPAGAVPEFASRLRDKGVFITPAELAELDAAEKTD